MYLDCAVKIPDVPGKISFFRKGKAAYVRYEVRRIYNPEKKYNVPDFKTIGKRVADDDMHMVPNENFLKYFGDVELPELKVDLSRSSCLRVGTFLAIRRVMEELGLATILMKYMKAKDCGLLLDLAAYTIICESNAAQYYPDYAYNHPLFTEAMHIYSDSRVSDLLASITDDQRIGFLNDWNATRDHREKVYISYDSTNKNCQAGDLELVEFGHPKVDKGLPVFNFAVAYDTHNDTPLFYEQYPGSIVDISQLQFMLEKAKGYGYKRVGFILDRGYFCKGNLQYMDECGYEFVIMVKGMVSFVKQLILENKGTFEQKRIHAIRRYKTYGKTIKKQMFPSDKRERYFHLFYSDQKACSEREDVEAKIERMVRYLGKLKGKEVTINKGFEKYFHLWSDAGTFLYPEEKTAVIEEEMSLCGYFVIVTSEKMTAKEALELYKSRDVSEKVFRGDKSHLGNKSLRVHSDEAALGKIFAEFIALIVRCKMYTLLKDETECLEKKPNYMTVPASIKELEKIEMIRGHDGKYHLDHAVTATQKVILKAYQMDANYVRNKAKELGDLLEKYTAKRKDGGTGNGETEEMQ